MARNQKANEVSKVKQAETNAILKWAKEYGISEDLAMDIAFAESSLQAENRAQDHGFDGNHYQVTYNNGTTGLLTKEQLDANKDKILKSQLLPYSSAAGLFMFTDATWKDAINSGIIPPGSSKFDPEMNAKAAMWNISKGRIGKWSASKGNWGQYYKDEELPALTKQSVIPTATPTPTQARVTPTQTQPTPSIVSKSGEVPVDPLLFARNIREDSGSQVAYPTPVITSGEGSLGKRPRIEAEAKMSKSMQEAKEIQQMYNKKNFFQKLLTPKPVFSAENDTGEKGYIRGSYVTQNYGVKNPEYYGKDIHRGTDYHATKGTPVYGLAGWKILDTYKDYNLGNVLVMQNPNTGERIKFAHLDQTIGKRGDIIDNNDTIIAKTGSSGKTIKGKSQMEHLHVEYTDQNGRTGDITKSAILATNQKAAEKGNPMVAMPKIVKPAMAAEKTSKEEPYYSQKGWEQSQSKTFEERARAGEYYGKSQGSYVIKPGDTLSALAKQYRTTVDDFVRSNPSITNPNVIRAGQSINVPSAVTDTNKSSGYIVRSGDNLTSIARNLGTTVNDLVRKNNIVNPNLIYTGTKLKI